MDFNKVRNNNCFNSCKYRTWLHYLREQIEDTESFTIWILKTPCKGKPTRKFQCLGAAFYLMMAKEYCYFLSYRYFFFNVRTFVFLHSPRSVCRGQYRQQTDKGCRPSPSTVRSNCPFSLLQPPSPPPIPFRLTHFLVGLLSPEPIFPPLTSRQSSRIFTPPSPAPWKLPSTCSLASRGTRTPYLGVRGCLLSFYCRLFVPRELQYFEEITFCFLSVGKRRKREQKYRTACQWGVVDRINRMVWDWYQPWQCYVHIYRGCSPHIINTHI